MSVPVGERDQIVETLLDDIVIHLVEVEIPPRELTSYIVTSLRNRVRTGHRDSMRAQKNDESAYAEYGDSTEKIVAECHSEYGMRASLPMDDSHRAPIRSAVKKLADESAKELSPGELALMIGVGRHIPLRDLADQLGLSHGALRVRLSRLRDRFMKLTTQYVATLDPAEKNEIVRFLSRAGVHLDVASQEQEGERDNLKRLPPEDQS